MSITNVTSKTFSATSVHSSALSCVKYLEDEEAHNTNELIKERNERVSSNFGNIAEIIKKQSKSLKHRSNAVQAYSIVQSFSDDELDYHNTEDIDKAHKIGIATAEALNKKFKSERAYAVYTQADNANHRLHNHIVFLNYDREQKPIQHGLSWKLDLLPINERVTSEFLTSAKQKAVREKTYKTAENIVRSTVHENKQARFENNQDKRKFIINSVNSALEIATTEKEFTEILAQKNITVQNRNKDINPNLESDEKGRNFSFRTKTGRLCKNLAFSFENITMRSNKFDLSTKDIVNKINENKNNKQRIKQRQVTVEKQADDTQIVDNNKQQVQVVKPQKAKSNNDFQRQRQPVVKQKMQRPDQSKSKVLVEDSVEKLSRQQTINVMRIQLHNLQVKIQLEKTKKRKEKLQKDFESLSKVVADMTSQQAVSETEKARKQTEEQY